MPYLEIIMIGIWAAFYYHAGEKEIDSGIPWAGLSLVLSTATLLVFHGGWLAIALGQVGLLLGIAAFRVWRDPG